MLKIAYVIGNGNSRYQFDLEQLRNKGTIIGCNALYRDFIPDTLITIDTKMINEVVQAQYLGHLVIPKNRSPHYKATKCPFKAYNTSGAAAIQYAGLWEFDVVFFIGMDCYSGNMYAKSKNYANMVSNYNSFTTGYKRSMEMYKETIYINVIKDKKDGITDKIKCKNYRGAISLEKLISILPKIPTRPPIFYSEQGRIAKKKLKQKI